MPLLEQTIAILTNTLGLDHRQPSLTESSPLLGALPELDSMAVMHLVAALEEHFGIVVHDDEISAATFETVGTLTSYLHQKTAA